MRMFGHRRWPTRAMLVIMVMAVLLFSAVGCQRASQDEATVDASDVTITLAVAPDPAVVGAAQLTVKLVDQDGQGIDGATVQLKGDMSHAGMQPVLAEASGTGGGVYLADFKWTMAGDWFVTVTATLPDGRTATRRFDLVVQR